MKHVSKKMVALLLVVAMIFSAIPSVFAAHVGAFTDVDSNAWYAEYVLSAYESGLMDGMTSTTFAPDANLTRAQTAMVLYRLGGEPPIAKPASFTDLSQDWYKNAVAWAEANKVVNGVGGGRFDPDGLITREALVTMLYRFAGADKVSENRVKDFPDADKVSDWAVDALNWALVNGIIGGTKETVDGKETVLLNPLGNATRGEFAKIVTEFERVMAPCDVHTWGEGKVEKEATCSEEGLIVYTCSVCGSTKNELIPTLAHVDEDGDKKCDVCGEEIVCEHVWNDGVVTTAATCTEDGMKTFTCTLCGETKTEVIVKLGHADANEDGKCDNCGMDMGTVAGNTFTKTDKLADGDKVVLLNPANGVALSSQYGSFKNLAGVEVVPVENVITTDDTNIIWTIVDNGDGSYGLKADSGLLGATATTGSDGKTYYDFYVDSTGEDNAWVVTPISGTDRFDIATKTLSSNYGPVFIEWYNGLFKGYSTGRDNAKFYNADAMGFQLFVLGGKATPECTHSNTSVVPAVPATCTTAGKTAGVKCNDCGKIISGCEDVAALGHTDVDGDDKCDRCGEDMIVPPAPPTGLKAGDTVLFTATVDTGSYEMTGFFSTSAASLGQATAFTGAPAGSFPMTVENGSESGTFAFKTVDGKYLSWTSGNSIDPVDSVNANASWYVTLNDDGTARILNATTATSAEMDQRVIIFNLNPTGTTPRFATYSKSPDKVTNTAQYALITLYVNGATTVCEHTNTVAVAAVPATCTTAGKTAGVKCADCGKILSGCEDVAALGHIDENGDNKCDRCDADLGTIVPPAPNAFALADGLKDGDEVILYNAGSGNAVAAVVKGNYYLDYVTIAPADGAITTEDATIVWTVSVNADDTYTFTNGTNVLSMNANTAEDGKIKTSLGLDGANPKMKLDTCNAANKSFYIYSANLTGGYGNIYLEWYAMFSDFSAYSTGADRLTEEAFGFQFYVKGAAVTPECTHSNTSVVPAVPATCTEAGKTAGVKCSDCGKILSGCEDVAALGHIDENEDGKCDRCDTELGTIVPPAPPAGLNVGDTVIFTATVDTGSYEMTGFFSTSAASLGQATAFTGTPAGSFPLTVENGSESGTFAFKTSDGKYLSWTSGNSIDPVDSVNANSSWVVTLNDDGTAKIVNSTTASSAEADQRVIIFNLNPTGTTPRFATYSKAPDKVTNTAQYALVTLYAVGGTTPCEHANTEAVAAVPATCTEAGKTAGVKCSDCGKILSGCEDVAALGHIDENEDGKCDRCDTELGTIVPPAPPAGLNVGDTVIFTATVDTGSYEMTGFFSTSAASLGQATAFTSTPAGSFPLTVENGSESGTYAFKTSDGKYLSWTSGNSLAAADSVNANSSWVVTLNDDGTAMIVNSTTASSTELDQRVIIFNLNPTGTTPRFATYSKAPDKVTNTAQYALVTLYAVGGSTPCEHTNTEAVAAVPATCTEAGKTAGVKCSDCGKIISGCEDVEALGHIDENEDGKCDRCGEDLTPPSGGFVLADGLNDGDEVILYNAGSGNALAAVAKGSYYMDYVTIAPTADAIVTDDATIIWTVAKDSDGNYTFTNGTNVLSINLTSEGKTNLSLDGANPKMTVESLNPANKSYVIYSATQEGSYGKIYLEWYAMFSDFSAYSTSVDRVTEAAFGFQFYVKGGSSAACAHSNTEAVAAVPATCTEAGKTAGVKCSDCGKLLSGCEDVAALGHNYSDGTCINCGKPEPTGSYSIAESVAAGDKIVVVAAYNGKYYALNNSSTIYTGSMDAIEVGIEGGKLDVPAGSDAIWTLETGDEEGKLKMKNSAGLYLSWESSTALNLTENGYSFQFTCGENTSKIDLCVKTQQGSRTIMFRNVTSGKTAGMQFRAYSPQYDLDQYSNVLTIWKVG